MKWHLNILPKEACTVVLESGISQYSWSQCPGREHMGCEVDIAPVAASSQGVRLPHWPLEHSAYVLCVGSAPWIPDGAGL